MAQVTVRAEAHLIMEFRDSSEIDMMIQELQKAKKENVYPFRYSRTFYMQEQR